LALVAFVHHAFGLPRTGIGLKKAEKIKGHVYQEEIRRRVFFISV
jgi:hypothetical protein